jgi:uncharacterized protein
MGRDTPLRVAALGDIHVRDSTLVECRQLLREVRAQCDVLVLCGDLTNRGTVHEAELVGSELSGFGVPVLAVLGNHDFECGEEKAVSEILSRAGVTMLDGEPCEIEGVGFAGVKGFCGGFDNRMLEPWGEPMIKQFVRESVDEALRLELALSALNSERRVVVLHYAPIKDTVEGEPEQIFPFMGSSRLAEPICRFGADVVFHGHAHRGFPKGALATGIPVYNVSLPLLRETSPEKPYVVVNV